MLEAMKKWTLTETVKLINQIKTAPSYVYDKYFAGNGVAKLTANINIPIKKGAGIVLESVSPSAEHLYHEDPDVYMLSITLPRFPLEKDITADEINAIKALENTTEQSITLAQRIGEIGTEHKDSFITTLEYMGVGALFGKVYDGKGKVLFEFASSAEAVAFRSDKLLIDSINEIDDALINELGGIVPYTVMASREFISGIAARAMTEELFKNGEAHWVEENNTRVLFVHGAKFIPYTANYTNAKGERKRFIAENTAKVIPDSKDVFKLYYTRANHVDAIKKAPTLFFMAAPERLMKGRGYAVLSEMRALPVCVRPGALIKLTYTAA